jgi:hypothetical protein
VSASGKINWVVKAGAMICVAAIMEDVTVSETVPVTVTAASVVLITAVVEVIVASDT